jgi:hypothetical protein
MARPIGEGEPSRLSRSLDLSGGTGTTGFRIAEANYLPYLRHTDSASGGHSRHVTASGSTGTPPARGFFTSLAGRTLEALRPRNLVGRYYVPDVGFGPGYWVPGFTWR